MTYHANLSIRQAKAHSISPAAARRDLQGLVAELRPFNHFLNFHPGYLVLKEVPAAIDGVVAPLVTFSRKHWCSRDQPDRTRKLQTRDHLRKLFEIGYGSDPNCKDILNDLNTYMTRAGDRIGTRGFLLFMEELGRAAGPASGARPRSDAVPQQPAPLAQALQSGSAIYQEPGFGETQAKEAELARQLDLARGLVFDQDPPPCGNRIYRQQAAFIAGAISPSFGDHFLRDDDEATLGLGFSARLKAFAAEQPFSAHTLRKQLRGDPNLLELIRKLDALTDARTEDEVATGIAALRKLAIWNRVGGESA